MSRWIERLWYYQLDWPRLVKPGISLGVLGAAALLGTIGVNGSTRWLLLATTAVCGVIAFVKLTQRIGLGVLALVPVAFLIPWGLNTGTLSRLNGTMLLLMLLTGIWLARMIAEQRVRLIPVPVNLPAILFVVAVGLAFLAGNLEWLPFVNARASLFSQIGGVLMLVLPVLAMLLVGNVLGEERWLRGLVWLFLGLGGLYLTASLIPGGGIITRLFNSKAVTCLFYTWTAALAGGMLLFNTDLKGWQRLLMSGLLILGFAIGFGQLRQSASNWVPALIVVGVLVVLKWPKAGMLLGIAGAAIAFSQVELLYTRLFGAEQYSVITRAATWPIMLELIKASPLLGLGPSNYYFYTPLFSLMGYYLSFNSHNNWLDLAAQVGLLGLGLFIWISIALGWMGWKLRLWVTNGFQRGYVNAAIAGLVGTLAAGLLADWFMPFVYNIGFDGFQGAIFAWLFLGGLITLKGLNAGKLECDDV